MRVSSMNVPIVGSILLLFLCALPFIFANLSVGLMFSTVAQNQLQSATASSFLYAFHFAVWLYVSFRGMPDWAQMIGSILRSPFYPHLPRHSSEGTGLLSLWPELYNPPVCHHHGDNCDHPISRYAGLAVAALDIVSGLMRLQLSSAFACVS